MSGINRAGWDFHRTLEGNAVSSPLSIGTAFSFARAGANDDTGATLDAIFGLPPGPGAHTGANAALAAIEAASVDTTTLEVANRVFTRITPTLDFVNIGAQHYDAGVEPLAEDNARAVDQINRWIDDRTRGLIPQLLGPGSLDAIELVVANTVYLKADWADPFEADLTQDGVFHAPNGEVTVPFMHRLKTVVLRYAELDGAVAVELPYLDGELSMWIIVPDDLDGLAAVEASLDAETLANLGATASRGLVEVVIPKWTTELPAADLLAWLCPQGLCSGAGFDGIAPGLFLTDAVHGAKIIVDEKGTEAAAATAMFMTTSAPILDRVVVADRPFLYVLTHEPTNTIAFVGRLVHPDAG